MVNPLRKRLYINPKVQGTWMKRNLCYWLLGCTGVFLMLTVWKFCDGATSVTNAFSEAWAQSSPVFLLSALLMPLFAYDTLKTSHRVVGPLFRLNRELSQLAKESRNSEPLRFRDGDFWEEIALQYNQILNRVKTQDQRLKNYFDQADENRPKEVKVVE